MEKEIVKQERNIAEEKLSKIKVKQTSVYNLESALKVAVYLLDSKLYENFTQIKKSIDESIDTGVPSTIKVMADLLVKLLNRHGEATPYTVYIEEAYIENIYRDSYYSHISSKHFEYERYCKRAFFVDGKCDYDILDIEEKELNKRLLGVCTIRPSVYGAANEGWLGRTLIRPELLDLGENPCICTANFTIHAFSKKLTLKAFPFMMQDGETITCAEATILLLMDYYGNKYSQYRSVVPSDIYEIAQKNSYQRAVPSNGITYTAVSKVLLEFGFFSRLYGNKSDEKAIMLKRIMHYYVDSAIPIAVDLKQKYSQANDHSVICIGYKKSRLLKDDADISEFAEPGDQIKNMMFIDSADLFDNYIIMNDSSCPYANMHFYSNQNSDNKYYDGSLNISGIKYDFDISMIVVPLSKRMFLEAMDAVTISKKILADESIGFQYVLRMVHNRKTFESGEKYHLIPDGTVKNPLVYRVFLATSGSFKRKRAENFKNSALIKTVYSVVPMPKFVWVCEIYSIESYKIQKAVGEIVLDATAYGRSEYNSVIIINYPHNIGFRLRDDDANEFLKEFSSGRYCHKEKLELINMYIHGSESVNESTTQINDT